LIGKPTGVTNRMFRIGFALTAILAILVGLLVGTLNSEPATLDLLWVQLHWPLGLLVLAALSVGLLLGLFLSWLFVVWPERLHQRNRNRLPAAQAVAVREPPDA